MTSNNHDFHIKSPRNIVIEKSINLLSAAVIQAGLKVSIIMGASYLTTNKLLTLNNMGLETNIALSLLSGTAAYVLCSAAKGVFIEDYTEICSQGPDSVVSGDLFDGIRINDKHKYRKEYGNKLIKYHYEKLKFLIASPIKSTFKALTLDSVEVKYFDSPEFEKNNTNLLHLLALLGKDKSVGAKKIKDSEVFNSELVQKIFEDSDDLIISLYNNAGNLKSFISQLEQSLGPESKIILKNFRDYSDSKRDYFEIYKEGIKNAVLKEQDYIVHKDLCNEIANVIYNDINGLFKEQDYRISAIKIGNFLGLSSFNSPSDKYDDCIQSAVVAIKILSSYQDSSFSQPIHKHIPTIMGLKLNDLSSKFSISNQIFDDLFAEHIEKPGSPNEEIAKGMFKDMKKRIKSHLVNRNEFKDDETMENNKEKFGISPFEKMSIENVANKTIENIQLRFLQAQARENTEHDSSMGL